MENDPRFPSNRSQETATDGGRDGRDYDDSRQAVHVSGYCNECGTPLENAGSECPNCSAPVGTVESTSGTGPGPTEGVPVPPETSGAVETVSTKTSDRVVVAVVPAQSRPVAEANAKAAFKRRVKVCIGEHPLFAGYVRNKNASIRHLPNGKSEIDEKLTGEWGEIPGVVTVGTDAGDEFLACARENALWGDRFDEVTFYREDASAIGSSDALDEYIGGLEDDVWLVPALVTTDGVRPRGESFDKTIGPITDRRDCSHCSSTTGQILLEIKRGDDGKDLVSVFECLDCRNETETVELAADS